MMSRIAPIIARFKTELAADKKRAIVLGVLLLILCVTMGRLFLGGSSPSPVVAQPAVAVPMIATAAVGVTTAESAPRVRPTLENATPSPAPVASTPNTAPTVQPPATEAPAKPLKPVEIEPGPKRVARDLFASSAWSTFPTARRAATTQPASDEDPEGGFWGRLAVSLADRGAEQRNEFQRVETLAQELRVEATMSGDAPSAYISGRLVHVGDTIKSFSVVSIDDRCVTVALDGHHVRLRIP